MTRRRADGRVTRAFNGLQSCVARTMSTLLGVRPSGPLAVLLCERVVEFLRRPWSRSPSHMYGPSSVQLQPALALAVPLECAHCREHILAAYPKSARVVRSKLCQWGAVRVCLRPTVMDSLSSSGTLGYSFWDVYFRFRPMDRFIVDDIVLAHHEPRFANSFVT